VENNLVDRDNTKVAVENSHIDLEKRLDEVSFLQVPGRISNPRRISGTK